RQHGTDAGRQEEAVQHYLGQVAPQRHAGVTEQRAAEGAAAQEVEILLVLDQVVRNLAKDVTDLGGETARQRAETGVLQVLQALGGDTAGKLVEVERLIDVFEVLVEQVVIGLLLQVFDLLAQQPAVDALGLGDRFGQQVEKGPGLVNTGVRLG